MSTKNKVTPKTSPSITDKNSALDRQVEWFYGEDFNLDEATEKYKAAANLAQEIEQDLNNLKNDIEIISKDFTKD
ncbi:hypothetical protein IJ096_00720 [Candidatus Saccharibacteria bacterium]|nr:hypothetical protein [Candidatus Saccharibacteria bacterium]